MGTWSSSLYGNDTTCDVRDTYMGFLQDQLTNKEAYANTLKKLHELIGNDEEPLLWFALAETQWKVGRLVPEVKDKALEWIKKNGGLEPWLEEGGKGTGWLKTLEKLKQKLESPMPAEKKIKKPEKIDMNPWNLNDVYAFHCIGKMFEGKKVHGKYILVQKIGEGQAWDSYVKEHTTAMRIHILDKMFDELPHIDDIDGLRILPIDRPDRANISKDYTGRDNYVTKKEPIQMNCLFDLYKMSEYPKKHLTFIGNKQGPLNIKIAANEYRDRLGWSIMWNIDDCFDQWSGIEYDTVGEGEYEYFGNV